jgi:large subunit ribosomal protein L15
MENLKPPVGSVKKRKRVGRGPGSGMGKTATKGNKGQKARKGAKIRLGFEGGQTPLHRRIPKRGFNNKIFTKEYAEINVVLLNKFEDGAVLKKEDFVKMDFIKKVDQKVKILGNGELKKKIEIHADKFSESAKKKIESAGGKAVVIV